MGSQPSRLRISEKSKNISWNPPPFASAFSGDATVGRMPGEHWFNSIGEYPMGTVLLIILILLVIGAFPAWPYSSGWGYYPTGGLGLAVLIVLILVLLGRI
jgi:hypothetical protein